MARSTQARLDYRLSGMDKFLAILGIIWGFLIFFTIPGWFGIRAWRRYGRGEPSSIRVYVMMGVFFLAVLIGCFLVVTVIAPLMRGDL